MMVQRVTAQRVTVQQMKRLMTASLVFLGVSGCSSITDPPPGPPPPPPPPPPAAVELTANEVVSGLTSPVHLAAPPGDARLFIVEQVGRIRIVDAGGQLLGTPFLEIVGQVDGEPEGGLLSMAFHPQFQSNGFVYINYTNTAGHTVLERYTVSGDPNRLDSSSAKLIIQINQPRSNHNGGQLQFGPDGMLYIFMGDGGGAGDPDDAGQDLDTLLGKILRIDVDGGDPFSIPSDNPFVGVSGARGEIWALGLRNPWRSSFDPTVGMLYVADVGQDAFEEVNAVSAAQGGVNYGWNTMEGSSCFNGGSCDMTGLTLPVEEYALTGGTCAVTGGHVYRGAAIPQIQGHYFYSDFCAGFLRSFRLQSDLSVTDRVTWNIPNLGNVSSFGEDGAGELYVVDLGGTVSRIEVAP